MEIRFRGVAAYTMEKMPALFHVKPVCCGRILDYNSAGLVPCEIEVDDGFYITMVYPRCPQCGKIVAIDDDLEQLMVGNA